jgi:hypothetical protein
MAFARSTIRNCQLLIATALALGMLTTVSQAYTQEQEQMCAGDAIRLCGSEIPDVDRVTACMVRQRSQLSPGCRAFFRDTEAEAIPVTTRRPLTIKPRKASKAKAAKPKKPKAS